MSLFSHLYRMRAQGDTYICSLTVPVFLIALAYTLVFFLFHADYTFAYYSIQGVPFSDAANWYDLACEVLSGHGLTGPWSAQRPVYALLLAGLYLWTGPSFLAAKVLNVLLASLAVTLVYIIVRRCFNRVLGLFSATAVLLSLNHLSYSIMLMSETGGCTFFLLSTAFLMYGLDASRRRFFFLSGIFLAATELTRPLCMLCVPGMLALIWLYSGTTPRPNKARLLRMSSFVAGILVILGPWIARQYAVHGILCITSKTVESLYAATSPAYGTWQDTLEFEADRNNLETARARHAYFSASAIGNIMRNPGFYARNCTRSYARYLRSVPLPKGIAVALILCLLLSGLRSPPESGGRTRRVTVAALLCLGVAVLPQQADILVAVAGIVWAIHACRSAGVLLCLNAFLCIGAGLAMVAGSTMTRVSVCYEWLFHMFCLGGLVGSYLLLCHLLKIPQRNVATAVPHGRKPARRVFPEGSAATAVRVGLWSVVAICSLSGSVLVFRTFRNSNTEVAEKLSKGQMQMALSFVCRQLPLFASETECAADSSFWSPVRLSDDFHNHGKLCARLGTVTSLQYFIPARTMVMTEDLLPYLFVPRSYDVTVAYLKYIGHVAFPGRIPRDLVGQPVVVVGRYSINMNLAREGRSTVEAAALIPWQHDVHEIDSQGMLLANNEGHAGLLEGLRRRCPIAVAEIRTEAGIARRTLDLNPGNR